MSNNITVLWKHKGLCNLMLLRVVLFLMGLCFLGLYIIPLGIRPLAIPDEVRYAEIPREMVDSNDWIVPRLNGLLYFEKPVMGYWLNGLAMKLFGENEFSVRFHLQSVQDCPP